MRPKPIIKYFGLSLLLSGSIVNIYMFFSDGYPTYLYFIVMAVGLVMLLLSYFFKNIKSEWQISIALIPLISAYIFFDISRPSKDIFLIPKNYKGLVKIYYDQSQGQKKEFEGNWRVYKIPASGYLETQFKVKGRSILLRDSKYFYIDRNNNRQELKHYCDLCEDRDTTSVQVIYGDFKSDKKGTFQTFYIDKPNNLRQVK